MTFYLRGEIEGNLDLVCIWVWIPLKMIEILQEGVI